MKIMYYSRYSDGHYEIRSITWKGWGLYATLPNECCWIVPGTQED